MSDGDFFVPGNSGRLAVRCKIYDAVADFLLAG